MSSFNPNSRTYDCISALQKFIRRGMEAEAGQVFFELADTGFIHWALSRLKVCAHEDCGLGDIESVSFALRAIEDCKKWYKAKNEAWRLAASNAILALARCRKSREADHFQAAVRSRNREGLLDLPDYCFDKHTRTGKRLGRGIQHFREEAAKLVNGQKDAYEEEAYRFWTDDTCSETEPVEKPVEDSLFGVE